VHALSCRLACSLRGGRARLACPRRSAQRARAAAQAARRSAAAAERARKAAADRERKRAAATAKRARAQEKKRGAHLAGCVGVALRTACCANARSACLGFLELGL